MLHKHTILPFVEYAGFILISCNIDDRQALQKCQNDALRICAKVSLKDLIGIDELHAKFKITSLEQRLYKRSPYFVCSNLRDALSLEIIDLPDIYSFKTRIKRLNYQYVDLLA